MTAKGVPIRLLQLVRQEPVLVQGAVQATFGMLIAFGVLAWTSEQAGFALAFTAAVLALAARLITSPTGDSPPSSSAPAPVQAPDAAR